MTWKLKRTTQCVKCPWRVATNPHDIPDGYSVERHRALENTIAKGFNLGDEDLHAMVCHETDAAHCIGWLVNQTGPGNNLALRILMLSCENQHKIRLRGKQHRTFEDTLPNEPT